MLILLIILVLFKRFNNHGLKGQFNNYMHSFIGTKINNKEEKKCTKEEIENKINKIQKIDFFFQTI